MAGYETPGIPQITPQGSEAFAVDTNYPGGVSPQVGKMTVNQVAPSNAFRNLLDGGDFTTNPFQRGTSFSGITNTLTYTADRWFAIGGASSSISVSQQAITAGQLPGFGNALQFGRTAANTNTAAITLGQVLETADSVRLQGDAMVLSLFAIAGANFSAVGGTVTATLYSGTGTNQSAANMIAGSWTGQTTLAQKTFSVTNTTWSNLSQIVLQMGTVPTTATQVGLTLSFVPSGTAGSNDWVQFAGVQLEVGTAPSQFEHRDVQMELEIAQRFFWQQNEPAAGVVVGVGMNTGAANQLIYIALPVAMLKAPTVTVSAGTFKTNQAGTATACTIAAGTTHTANAISLTGNSTGTAGQATMLIGGGGTGNIQASADL